MELITQRFGFWPKRGSSTAETFCCGAAHRRSYVPGIFWANSHEPGGELSRAK
jgi:hypothetical protein